MVAEKQEFFTKIYHFYFLYLPGKDFYSYIMFFKAKLRFITKTGYQLKALRAVLVGHWSLVIRVELDYIPPVPITHYPSVPL